MLITRSAAQKLVIAFAIASALVFLVKILTGELTPVLAGFFDAIEFTLALILGFLLQIIISSDQLRQEFQRFAISAYRRIADISTSLVQIRQDIATQKTRADTAAADSFDVISARAQEIERQVSSSQDDWRDFLRREIPALEEIERRREQIRVAASSTTDADREATDEVIEALREEIRHFANELPQSLKTLIDVERGDVLPRTGRYSDLAASYILNSLREEGYIRIPVDTRSELNDERIQAIIDGAPYGYFIDVAMSSEYFVIVGSNGEEIGLVDNPIDGVYERDFYLTLREFLPESTEQLTDTFSGMPATVMPGSEFDMIAEDWDRHIYIRVPV